MEPVPASVPQSTPQQLTHDPLPTGGGHQIGHPESPSTILGFTLTELAHVTIQVAGIIAAVFGAWAVKSYESANFANKLSQEALSESKAANLLAQNALQQTLYANILAIMSLCISEQFRNSTECLAVLLAPPFSSIIQHVIPLAPPPGPPGPPTLPAPTPPASSSLPRHIGFGAIVGIIIAVVVTVAISCLLLIRHRRAKISRF